MYNKSRRRHHWFWAWYQNTLPASLHSRTGVIVRREQDPEAHGLEDRNPGVPAAPMDSPHTAFLVVGLVILIAINAIFLADIELTLSRNQQFQSREENNWGFGQVLALLLLVVPMRDFVTSIVDIRQRQSRRDGFQTKFTTTFREALEKNSFSNDDNFEGREFRRFLRRGVNPDTRIGNDLEFVTLLQFAVYKGATTLVEFLLEKKANQTISVAAREWHVGTAFLFLKDKKDLHVREKNWTVIQVICAHLQNKDHKFRLAALKCLMSIGKQDNVYEETRPAIPVVIKLLNDSQGSVSAAALKCLSSLAEHGNFNEDIQTAIPGLVERLDDSEPKVYYAVVKCLSKLGAHGGWLEKIRASISNILGRFQQEAPFNYQAALLCLSSLGAYDNYREDIRTAIPQLLKLLEYSGWEVPGAAMECISSLGGHNYFREEIKAYIPVVRQRLEDSDDKVRKAAVECFSSLQTHSIFKGDFHEVICTAIPVIRKHLNDSNHNVSQASIKFFLHAPRSK
ncbi:hypothetical protein H0H87_001911 [Tephrocybe sp. NHM501043]|nr:hypothetical protein H0H87_001911 [Tephrocybe sp. NHM501043]